MSELLANGSKVQPITSSYHTRPRVKNFSCLLLKALIPTCKMNGLFSKKGLDASLLHVYACIAVPVVEISSTAQATRTCSL